MVRTGSLTVSTMLETLNGRPVYLPRAVGMLTMAVRDLCDADQSGPCPTQVRSTRVLPPPSGETRRPGRGRPARLSERSTGPGSGPKPIRALPNVAATTCDKAGFARAGAPGAATRTFLIPQAKLPDRFGITETYGRFTSPRKAHALVDYVSKQMASCEKRDLGASVSSEVVEAKGFRGSEYALWRLDSEINDSTSVGFWMGVVRVGRLVAQVNFTPAGDNDIDVATFQALITRARDRLFELPAARR